MHLVNVCLLRNLFVPEKILPLRLYVDCRVRKEGIGIRVYIHWTLSNACHEHNYDYDCTL